MKFSMLVFVFALVAGFLYDFSRVNIRDNGKALLRAALDAAMILLFAILERGRWA